MGLTFVNIHGETVPVAPPGAAAGMGSATKRAPAKTVTHGPGWQGSFHKGYLVVGFSPAQLAEARRVHDLAARHSPDAQPFDEVEYMRSAKPRKVRAAPYQLCEAAEQCAEMARGAGWKMVQTIAKTKGRAE